MAQGRNLHVGKMEIDDAAVLLPAAAVVWTEKQ
jgi:hypothetical protein